ncbi:ExbD/TolR family protein [Desulfogranum mediterraneum]|uniref:ExbD/TolR family protein n=1 Tax=Desulfogranum mediterraneum TaxID=160661 RepID=UPI00041C02F7|nr:biopolymer transporter ExbD [Desulfogranum mediterraneum]
MLNISAARRRRKQGVELNIAPLIDMVFILLIFFLVNTSFVKETGVEVSRPTASTAHAQAKSPIMIGIDRENRIFMEHREIDVRAVRANVERALAENPEGGVIIVSDKSSNAGMVIAVMDGCRLAGADNISLAARIPQG